MLFLGLIIAFGATRIGLQACMLKTPLIILTAQFCKSNFSIFQKRCFESCRLKAPLPSSPVCWEQSAHPLLQLVEHFACVSANNPPPKKVKIAGSREAGLMHFNTAKFE